MWGIQEIISSIQWYFKAKNLALKNALSIKCPLSVEQQNDIRIYYSLYFANLLSVTEMLLEKEYEYKDDFKQELYKALSFPEFPDGKKNYNFLRELRNAIIHRGFDICSSAHVKDSVPLMLAPQSITDRSGEQSYSAFGFYLLDIISKCESIIGSIIEQHFKSNGLLQSLITDEQMIADSKAYLNNTVGIPIWVKNMALSQIEQIDFKQMQQEQIKNFLAILHVNVLKESKLNF